MSDFPGFPDGKMRLTPIPASFFRDLLPKIDSLAELKLALYVFWRLDRTEGAFRYLRASDVAADELFMQGLGATKDEALSALQSGLAACVRRGLLLEARPVQDGREESYFFLNSAKGRAGVQAVLRGSWRPSGDASAPLELVMEAPNIFRLYEENFGPLTPMIADALSEAEDSYPPAWIEDAIRIAVENNKRSWRYVSAILERWQREGRDARQDRRDTEKARRRYSEWEDPGQPGER